MATKPRKNPKYARGKKKGVFDLDVYDVRDLVERTNLSMETITREARNGRLPGRNFEGHAGWRFPHSGVMWWLSGSTQPYDPAAWNVPYVDEPAEAAS